jgi:hypothetical protein
MNQSRRIRGFISSIFRDMVVERDELFRHLAERLKKRGEPKRRLSLVPAAGNPITQEEINDALDSD